MIRDKKPSVLFLYTELAGYIRNCFEALTASGVNVHVVAYPVNPEAPFRFDETNTTVRYYRREDFDDEALLELVDKCDPQAVFCSGWIDMGYLRTCRKIRNKRKTILISDNIHSGDARTTLSALRARIAYRGAFDEAFVPGAPQARYARIMGFARSCIHEGFYTVDTNKRAGLAAANIDEIHSFPKRFVFVGRYVDFKGVEQLWEAYRQLGGHDGLGWELHCLGTGPLYASRPEIPGLYHHGFVQPAQMDTFVAGGGVFVLPSHREPWGMVVHEFASAGYPLICSNKVGAASAFLRPGTNGILVKPGDVHSLSQAMSNMAANPDTDLRQMARKSLELAPTFTVDKWVQTVHRLTEH